MHAGLVKHARRRNETLESDAGKLQLNYYTNLDRGSIALWNRHKAGKYWKHIAFDEAYRESVADPDKRRSLGDATVSPWQPAGRHFLPLVTMLSKLGLKRQGTCNSSYLKERIISLFRP